jgi:hypothetical protein
VEQYGESSHAAKLGESLADEDFRNSFSQDQSQALRDAGIDEDALPDGVVEALRRCEPEELAAVAKVRGALMGAGVTREDAGDIV